MTIGNQQNFDSPGSNKIFNRKFSLIFLIAFLFFIFLLVVVLGVRAFTNGGETSKLITVPDDYPTIQAAVNAASPGDIIRVRPGIYNESVILNKPVSLTAENFDQINPTNNTTIIDGGGGATTILIPSGMTQMPTIRGFVIRNSNDGIQASSEFIAEFNYFYSSINLVVYRLGAGGINRNNVYFNSGNDAIHLNDTNRPLLIENNRIMYAGDDGVEIDLQNTTTPPSTIDVDIRNNMIIGSREDGIQLIDYSDEPQNTNRRFIISGNLIANSKKAGIGLMPNANVNEDYSGADMQEAIRAFNNTFYGNDYGISGGDNLVAFNNIIANSISLGAWKVQGAPENNSVIAYTLFYNNRLDTDQSTLGPGNLSGQNPLFAADPNPGPDGTWETVDDDFSGLLLQSGSPAIDRGVTQYIANNGESIPLNPITGFTGAAPDLGWREFGSPVFITPTVTATALPTSLFTLTPGSPTPIPLFTLTPGSPTLTLLTATAMPVSPTATVLPATTKPVSPTPAITSTSTSGLVPTLTIVVTQQVQVTIQSIGPNSAQADTTMSLTITGSGFANGAIVTIEGGQGQASEVAAIQVVNSTTLIATVNAKATGSFGSQTWDVRVTNPDGSFAILADGFTVNP